MQLDFITLYVIILLNSLTLAIVWAAIAWVYRDVVAARYWLASALMTILGGALLTLEGFFGFRYGITIAGNALVVAGFCMMWNGIRVFDGRPPALVATALIVVTGIALMLAVGEERASQNVAYAVAQMVPIALILFNLARRERSLGAGVAAVATVIALAGHAAESSLNVLRLTGRLSTEGYYSVAALSLVAVIFAGTVWNFGFLLMAIDRLRARLEAQALVDDLTGLANRRQFMRTALRIEEESRRAGTGFCLLLIDLDKFKEINDGLGHAAGDACLKHFSEVASARLGTNGVLARMSGDEFCVILPGCGMRRAERFADGLVEAAWRQPCTWKERIIPISVSIGVAEWRAGPDGGLDATLEAADAALYAVKNRGRNGFGSANADPANTGRPARKLRLSAAR